jgi:hypothetical protein
MSATSPSVDTSSVQVDKSVGVNRFTVLCTIRLKRCYLKRPLSMAVRCAHARKHAHGEALSHAPCRTESARAAALRLSST